MSAHTPGPWRAELAPDDGLRPVVRGAWELVVGEGSDRMVLAARSPWPNRAEESNANAHLIAAAPELLAVARRWLRVMGDAGSDRCACCPDEYVCCRCEVEAAIAKAEGKS